MDQHEERSPEEVTALALAQEQSLSVIQDPETVIADASKAAKILADVVKRTGSSVDIQGNHFLKVEGWETVGKFYGLAAHVEWTRFVEFGEVKGFEARAIIRHVASGREVSSGEAMCLSDERRWGRASLNQIRSMAQTRSVSKAFRNCLSWVVVLAGYQPTTAEEMDGGDDRGSGPAPPQPRSASSGSAPRGSGSRNGSAKPISGPQHNRLWAKAKSAGWDDDDVKALVKRLGFEKTTEIHRGSDYDNIIAAIEAGPGAVPASEEPPIQEGGEEPEYA